MKAPFHIILIALLCLLFLQASGLTADPDNAQPARPAVKAAVIPCKGMIDRGLYESIQRRTKLAMDAGAEYLIYEIDTYGGDLFAAFDISNYLLHEVNPKAHTVAYISKKAISAGAMISVACEDIIMKEKTTIGDCAPIQMGGKLEGVEREKVETVTRAAFVNSAEANGYPEALLKAMVTQQIEVYKIKNTKTKKYEFFEGTMLPTDKKKYDLGKKQLIVKSDELLTLTASQAVEYGVARTQVESRAGAVDFLAKRDAVTIIRPAAVFKTTWSEEMVRWLNSPAVMSVLIMLALLGVYIEFNTPGLGLPGLTAAICFTVLIGSKYLTGMANWVEVALFVVGLLLLMVEIFILPGFGIAGSLGIICMLTGLFGMLIKNPPDKLPWPTTSLDWRLFTNGITGLLFGFVGFVILAWLLTKYLLKMEFLSGLILVPAAPRQGGEIQVSMTAPAESEITTVKVGDTGEVISTLRPTGKAKFAEAIVDVVAVAKFLEKGTDVEIIEIHGNRVVVKKVGD